MNQTSLTDRKAECDKLCASIQSAATKLQTALAKEDWHTLGEIATSITPDTERLTYNARIINMAAK